MSNNLKNVPYSDITSGIPVCHYKSSYYNFDDKYEKKDKNFYKQISDITFNLLNNMNIHKISRYLFLCGTPGSGKTHYMVGLYKAMIYKLGYIQGNGALFLSFQSLCQEIIDGFQNSIPIRTAIQAYTQSEYLFIDDFTSSERIFKNGSLEFNIFRDVLIERYDSYKMLIASSNFNAVDLISEIDKLYGGYISSRISKSIIIQFPNIDLRKIIP